MIPLIILIPLFIGIVLIPLLRDQMKVRYLSLIATIASLALFPLISYGTYSINWIILQGFQLNISVSITPLNYLLLAIILVVSPLIFLYSTNFMDLPSEQKRFYAEMLAFEISMLAFAMAGNFILFLIAWEFLSLTSYLLIGFWYTRERAVRAARKAITTVLIGDLALLAAIAVFWNVSGSLQFSDILASNLNQPQAYLGGILILLAVLTKSAQFPFHDWLPDAMEGPTPVSAFLHSTTMVKAGVFTIILLLPIFTATGLTTLLLGSGVITAILATYYAIKEMHIKRVIAYSTVQELSLMTIAFSTNALYAGIYFFFVQSFYKALLFFSSGVVMKATGKENLEEVSDLKYNRFVYITTLFGILSLAGFIPFSGFLAGEGLGYSLQQNLIVYIFITIISLTTSFYIFRWFFYLSRRSTSKGISSRYANQPRATTLSMFVLAFLTLASSLFFIYQTNFLNSSQLGYLLNSSGIAIDLKESAIYLAIITLGTLLSYLVYVKHIVKKFTFKPAFFYAETITNKIYNKFTRFVYLVSEGADFFDAHLSDLFDGFGYSAVRFGSIIKRFSVGEINYYALIFAISLIILFVFFYLVP